MNSSLADYFETLNRALSANEVAKILGVRRDTIYLFVKAGEIPKFNIGRTKTMLRFDSRQLAEWIRERQGHVMRVPRSETDLEAVNKLSSGEQGQLLPNIKSGKGDEDL